jgi:hypothetical protein
MDDLPPSPWWSKELMEGALQEYSTYSLAQAWGTNTSRIDYWMKKHDLEHLTWSR